MYKGKKIIGIIPARGGSKGIPRKNIVDLGGMPLIGWSIIRAKQSKYIDRLILSSEDDEIIRIAKEYGCEVPFKRPGNLADDKASSVDVVLHALKQLNLYSSDYYFILLQPTSPFRTTKSIDDAIEFTIDNNFDYVMSVSRLDKSPYHIYLEKENYILEPLYENTKRYTRRQDLPKALVSNGVLYVVKTSYYLKQPTFKPKVIRFFKTCEEESVDIDTIKDLEEARSFQTINNIQP